MTTNTILNLINTRTQLLRTVQFTVQKCNYAKKESAGVSMLGGALKKKKLGKVGPVAEKRVLPVETDPNRLVKYACGTNIYKTGEDVELKPDSEYPEWLWNIRTGDPAPLEELDPNSKEYWRRIRKMAMRRNNKLAQLKSF
ncbi:unnamed protein product [Brassicogethes aeneus]|uniref:Large ribosomal subunit protein mL54 n=1 Tax=Brassicogethes aeneus TaxID=1431903 RepID=A0A9P0ATX4_BRAAE|nr:unnamed protein product [Brassicogethes aeneus]